MVDWGRSYRFRRLKHLGSVGLLVDGANLVPQSPRRGVRGTIYNVLTFNLQGPITLVDEPRILHWHVFGAGGAYNP